MPKAEKEQSKLFWLSIKLLNDVNPCKLGSVLQFRKFPESSKISNSFVLKNPSTNTKCAKKNYIHFYSNIITFFLIKKFHLLVPKKKGFIY
jgi:hypothetical protein